MSPWSFSWLPALPTIDFSLPSGIQKRFISFALRQSLGHLLKPGQLDVQQVDSQIGSGYVQVRDLELNDEAINALISGLPIRLRDGSVGKVTARIPWPNPLTSSVGLSLESLHLTFYLEPTLADPTERPFTDNLADSVASVAETFIHEELSAREEAALRESFHPDLARSDISEFEENVPGGLDPFISEDEVHQHDAEPPGVSIFATLIERLLARFQFDATDTRITIVNPQNASFTLIVPDIRYSTESQATAPQVPEGGVHEAAEKATPGEVRKVIITGATVTTRCLRPPSPKALAASPATSPDTASGDAVLCTPSSPTTPVTPDPPAPNEVELSQSQAYSPEYSPEVPQIHGLPSPAEPSSPYHSDSSDMDEETQMFMSQSIAMLPPRPISPASSVASSMYQSAISTSAPDTGLDDIPEEASQSRSSTPSPPERVEAVEEQAVSIPVETVESPAGTPPASRSPVTSPFQRRLDIRTAEIEDETVLSLGSEPIEIRLTTPSPHPPPVPQPSPSSAPSNAQHDSRAASRPTIDDSAPRQDRMRVDLTMGTIACALSATQIRSVIDIAEVWTSHSPAPSPLQVSKAAGEASSPSPFDDLEAALRVRGVVILLLSSSRTSASSPDDALTEFFSRPLVPPRLPGGYVRVHIEGISSSVSIRPGDVAKGRRSSSGRDAPSISASLTISEISAFAFLPPSSPDADMSASPILVTDPHLPSQYTPGHVHPSLDTSPEHSASLPVFDIIDWTHPSQRSAGAKLSWWRTKPVATARPSSQSTRRDPEPFESSSPPFTRPFPVVLPSSPGRLGLAGLSPSPGKGQHAIPKPTSPALTVKFRSATRDHRDAPDVQVSLAPVHVFLDVGAMLSPAQDGKSELLRFVEELAGSRDPQQTQGLADAEPMESDDDTEDGGSRPGTPRAPGLRGFREDDAERERRRLEQLVLDDLDLGYDYRKPTAQTQTTPRSRRVKKSRHKPAAMSISVNLPSVRVEIRVPPPAQRQPRSGAVILDIHDLCLTPGRAPERGGDRTARFGTAEDLFGAGPAPRASRQDDNILLGATWKRIVVAYSLVGESKARAILSLGPLTAQDSGSIFGVGTPPAREVPGNSLQPQVLVSRTPVAPSAVDAVSSTAISLDIPSVHVELSKPLIDGLQLWADDLSQLMEAAFSPQAGSDTGTQRAGSGDSSMIGSRFFARTETSGSAPDSGVTSLAGTIRARQEPRSETAVKITVTEAAVRLWVPREDNEQFIARPFDLVASDVDVLLELKPEGKDETVVTVGVMDLNVHDHSTTGRNCFLSLTTPRSLNTTVKSALKLRFTSLVVPETTAKESRVRLTLCGITYHFYPDLKWATDLGRFVKAPPGAFESVVPSERTRVNVKVLDTSIRLLAPSHPGAVVPYIGELDFSTVIEGNSPTSTINLAIPALSLLLIDDISSSPEDSDASGRAHATAHGVGFWKSAGYALFVEVSDLILSFKKIDSVTPPDTRLLIEQGDLRLHMCADTMGALGAFIGDLSSAFKPPVPETPAEVKPRIEPPNVSKRPAHGRSMLSSLDEQAFRRVPEVGAAPDMIEDDLPTNPDYLDESFGAAAGLRELSDDEFDESDVEGSYTPLGAEDPRGVTSAWGGETVRILRPEGIRVVENYFETLPPDQGDSSYGNTTFRTRVHDFNVVVFLYDGYDWVRTRKIIEEKAKEMRRKLAKIRQLVASGQTPDPSVEETNALLFNSVYIGLEHNIDELEPGALIAAIDEELNEDFETTTQSSWQSLKPQPLASPGRGGSNSTKSHRRRLRRAKGPSMEFRLEGLDAEVDNYREDEDLVSRILATIKEVEILDHIKTSTWKKFLTSLHTDARGNVRESDSNMVRVELRTLHPVPGHPSEEARLRAKVLPLRLHVDQDALDFLKQFFSFKDPDAAPPAAPSEPSNEIYFQQAEVFPIDLKLDYKPRRVDYRALREGRTIELMNFFHFDGSEMTLRHLTLNGITGWPRFFDLLNDLWTPDVKATQLVEVISGVAPIRSVVNVGSGVADLVLLPIAQYKKDGRVVRGLQKGANSFVQSTAMEAIRLGARLATGTQVILEQAETVLGGHFRDQVTAEALQIPPGFEIDEEGMEEDAGDLISKYADQPTNVKEGVKSAYKSLKRNLNSAAQTILAVPMEVYERSGNEGPVRAVVRAVPIAVLKPMIGASEAVSKTLLGLQNTLDPNIRQENEAKYKQR
ncbi:uncharacterized protein TRAVEDRAFT_63914 [Trametes versicolor FP-101664 SS1]|uniref:uncharacterized protein n=1 Tax=Trametes versicolor (strain FP-101664) TaxID=717944 RepID=UPI00046247B7|nr:uncharacterized protein TRAVEDRAFT_63914 [Trametes versicolor FP-101664 SS1]EIW60338.1 hypothetical protein TRAVEDRAFT_63914 [Trametes versicolor FP-101664 SS1]